jgi:Putative peptidoglycan binding domain/Helix-turn-helix domain/Transglycosylase SLT domain
METDDAQVFAAYLRLLKNRTSLSYEALAQRSRVSGSSLQRYCAGIMVPSDYGPIYHFGRACGATQDELRELHRLWALADASRRGPSQPAPEPGAAEPQGPASGTTLDGAPSGDGAADSERRAGLPRRLGAGGRGRGTRVRWALAGLVVALAAVISTLLALLPGPARAHGGSGASHTTRLLFSHQCPTVISLGEIDKCVREVQTLLLKAGTTLTIDGDFGPQTLRRVTAFQVLAGLEPNGVVDQATKQALYAGKVSMRTWSPAQVARRIRQVFTQAPAEAVAIARCQSFLDPLYILSNTNGTRDWGVFQISDLSLQQLGGTPAKALNPEWNIEAAWRLWKMHQDFSAWPFCVQAYQAGATPKS